MAGFIQNILWNSVEGFVEAGKRSAGGYAGDALIKAGDLIENSGRSVGNGIERTVSGYGSKITGQTYQPSGKALPSTARKPAVKRSNSTPAPTTSSKTLGGSKTPLGTNKYPGGKAAGAAQKQLTNGVGGAQKQLTNGVGGAQKQLTNGVGGAQKQLTNGLGGAKSTAGGVTGAGKGVTGGVVGGANKSLGNLGGAAKSTTGGLTNAGKGVTGGLVGGANRTVGNLGGTANGAVNSGRKALPKANAPSASASKGPNLGSGAADKPSNPLPKAYNPAGGSSYSNTANSSSYANPYPTEKKTAVKPGQSKPFKAPGVGGAGAEEEKPYPGTNTLPGQGGKTPVNARKQRYRPAERMKGTAEHGKVQHFTV
ncbi:hypothetical protein K491DRAFT_680534 [Lophiostoma macrostomum CBS 122681]|uniref:Uncharacterized protein n=1 Tax=Lophiostoma macrostomum CBS 122681 TaxID=1314788 RepID=A0A6A6T3R0_9PLEO|nr:hypothetical protein K491DRAFT_680534 [Lophiostoma macrostomum CBS 122681]